MALLLLFFFARQLLSAAAHSYRASHLAKEPFVSFPQFPYGSPAELTRSKQIPGAGFAPACKDKHETKVQRCYHKHDIPCEQGPANDRLAGDLPGPHRVMHCCS